MRVTLSSFAKKSLNNLATQLLVSILTIPVAILDAIVYNLMAQFSGEEKYFMTLFCTIGN